jgi:hypothetical protein
LRWLSLFIHPGAQAETGSTATTAATTTSTEKETGSTAATATTTGEEGSAKTGPEG